MLKEFKAFALQGGLIPTAIAFVMGAAFTKLTEAFISGIVMPLISTIMQVNFKDWNLVLAPAGKDAQGKEIAAIALTFGDFASAALNFLIVAFVMFMIVKALKSAKVETDAAVPPQEALLAEIRDLLKK